MRSFLLVSHGKSTALTRFFILCAIVVALTLGTGIADAGPARKHGGHKPGHGQNQGHKPGHAQNPGSGQQITNLRQALNMRDKTQVTVRVNIIKNLGGNRYRIADQSGSCEAQIGPKELGGLRVPTHDPITIQGEIKKDKHNTRIHVKQIIVQQNHGQKPGHGQNQGPKPGHAQNPNLKPGQGKSQIVSVTPSAVVEKLKGNKNNLTVTIVEKYADGKTEKIKKTFSINNNAADTYVVGPYKVYVDTKGNDQIRACKIVN